MRILKTTVMASALTAILCGVPETSSAGIGIAITIAPPVLPVYVQPPCPVEGYLWTPGYWAWGPAGYYWVPGVWIAPPAVGLLWTPGYWGFGGGGYFWHAGYWGPHVGFYGGINYGFGYTGVGFFGGVWSGGVFRYNTAVTNVNRTIIRNVYVDRTVVNRGGFASTRASFNGPGGVVARPTAMEQAALREQHVQPTANQMAHERTAGQDRTQLASVNHGRPSIAAMDGVNGRRYTQQGRPATGANGGMLTAQQRSEVNRPQNTTSRPAYNNQRTAASAPYAHNQGAQHPYAEQTRVAPSAHTAPAPQHQAAREEPRSQNGAGRPATEQRREERSAPR